MLATSNVYSGFLQKLRRFIRRHEMLLGGEPLLVAVSGGIDSMVLLDMLIRLAPTMNLKLAVAHYEHGLREEASKQDAQFVVEAARRHGLKVYVGHGDVKQIAEDHKLSIEEAARRARYTFLRKVARKHRFPVVVTGHTANDNAETVLLNLIRGSGVRGLAAIPPMRQMGEGVILARPLLDFERAEIERYAKEMGVEWREDESNESSRFVRNRLRAELLPMLQSYNPSIVGTLNTTAEIMRNLEQYLSQSVQTAIERVTVEKSKERLALNLHQIKHFLPAMQTEIVQRGVSQAFDIPPISFNATERALGLLYRETGQKTDLGAGLTALRDRDSLVVLRELPLPPEMEYPLRKGEEVEAGRVRLRSTVLPREKVQFTRNGRVEYFDADKLPDDLVVRSWREGDRFRPLGMEGEKKVSDFLVDSKTPRDRKRNVLVLTAGEEIVWVCGMRIDDRYKVTDETANVMRVEMQLLSQNQGQGGRAGGGRGGQKGERSGEERGRRDRGGRGEREEKRDQQGRDERQPQSDRPRDGRGRDERQREDRGGEERPREERSASDRQRGRSDDPRDERGRDERGRDERRRGERDRDDRERDERPREPREEGRRDEGRRDEGGRDERRRDDGRRREDSRRGEGRRDERPRDERPRDERPRDEGAAGDQRAEEPRERDARGRDDAARDDRSRQGRSRDDRDRRRDDRRRDEAPAGPEAMRGDQVENRRVDEPALRREREGPQEQGDIDRDAAERTGTADEAGERGEQRGRNDRRDRGRRGDRRHDEPRAEARSGDDPRRSDDARTVEDPRGEGRRSDEPRADERRADEPRAEERRADERRVDEPRADERRADRAPGATPSMSGAPSSDSGRKSRATTPRDDAPVVPEGSTPETPLEESSAPRARAARGDGRRSGTRRGQPAEATPPEAATPQDATTPPTERMPPDGDDDSDRGADVSMDLPPSMGLAKPPEEGAEPPAKGSRRAKPAGPKKEGAARRAPRPSRAKKKGPDAPDQPPPEE